jgi:hypothetical protein
MIAIGNKLYAQPMRLSTDFGIFDVQQSPKHPEIQLVIVVCGCLGVWSRGELVGYAKMCEAHEMFKLLARVWQSAN